MFPKAVGTLLRNPILMCQNASLTFYLLGMLGFFLFLPKYLETQFRQPAGKANIISGMSHQRRLIILFCFNVYTWWAKSGPTVVVSICANIVTVSMLTVAQIMYIIEHYCKPGHT